VCSGTCRVHDNVHPNKIIDPLIDGAAVGEDKEGSKNGQTQSFPPLQGTKELLFSKRQHLGGFHVQLKNQQYG